MTRALAILIVYLALMPSTSHADRGSADATDSNAPAADYSATLPERLTHEVGFHGGRRIVFAPNGPYAFVSDTRYATNVWAELIYFWPWWSGMLAGALLLVALWRVRQIWRNPRPPGADYCRRCNYCLTGIQSETCPECGELLTAKARRAGVPFRRRLVWPMVLALPLIAHLILLSCGVPRDGAVSHWYVWPSFKLYEWKSRHEFGQRNHFGGPHGISMRQVVQIDLRTGETVAMPISAPRQRWRYVQDAFTPDGEQLVFVCYHQPLQLRIWDVERMRTAQVIDAPQLEEPAGHWGDWIHIDFPPDLNQIVTARNSVVRWDLAANEAHRVTDEEAWPMRFADYRQTAAGSGLYVGSEEPVGGYFNSALPDRVIDAKGNTLLHLEPETSSARYTFAPDGQRMFIYRRGVRQDNGRRPFIEVLDLADGRSKQLPWPEVEKDLGWGGPRPHPLSAPRKLWVRRVDGAQWLLAQVEEDNQNQLWAYSLEDERWREVFRSPKTDYKRFHITRDNHLWLLTAEEGQPFQAEGYRLTTLLE